MPRIEFDVTDKALIWRECRPHNQELINDRTSREIEHGNDFGTRRNLTQHRGTISINDQDRTSPAHQICDPQGKSSSSRLVDYLKRKFRRTRTECYLYFGGFSVWNF